MNYLTYIDHETENYNRTKHQDNLKTDFIFNAISYFHNFENSLYRPARN